MTYGRSGLFRTRLTGRLVLAYPRHEPHRHDGPASSEIENGDSCTGRSYVRSTGRLAGGGGARPQGAPARALRGVPPNRLPEAGLQAHCDPPARSPGSPARHVAHPQSANEPSWGEQRCGDTERLDRYGRSGCSGVSRARTHRRSHSRARPAQDSRRSRPPVSSWSTRVQLSCPTDNQQPPVRLCTSTVCYDADLSH
jgi:hypothetical protein